MSDVKQKVCPSCEGGGLANDGEHSCKLCGGSGSWADALAGENRRLRMALEQIAKGRWNAAGDGISKSGRHFARDVLKASLFAAGNTDLRAEQETEV